MFVKRGETNENVMQFFGVLCPSRLAMLRYGAQSPIWERSLRFGSAVSDLGAPLRPLAS